MANERRCSVRLLVFGASLREGSMNDRLATLGASVAEEKGATVERATMSQFECPAYDTDVEISTGLPAGAQALHDKLQSVDGFMIASPEYNASMSGVLKNTIDWVSRFRPQPFNGKQGFLMAASPSMTGGKIGLWALRQPLEHLGARTYPDMFALAQAHRAFDDAGRIADAKLQNWFETTIECFIDLVEASKHYPHLKKQWVEFLGERPDEETTRVELGETAAV
ncbi:MAG: NADPH-dependent FMN reductase [Gemmatimonadetes bacterium]|nr:MAG: NADPH-dependent FMN reductase [Gemmatimonadota bacterium]PYO78239.1 MAG: NADPH-dependent FMN reductase [Gemmatimonadota bacterium]